MVESVKISSMVVHFNVYLDISANTLKYSKD